MSALDLLALVFLGVGAVGLIALFVAHMIRLWLVARGRG